MNSLGKDLARIRHHLNLSHDDIYQKIRISPDTLRRIENGSIFHDESENKVYVRSFVRTYAKALKIDDALAQKALDQQEEGTYDRLLLSAYPELAEQVNPPHPLLDDDETESGKQDVPPTSGASTKASTGAPGASGTTPGKIGSPTSSSESGASGEERGEPSHQKQRPRDEEIRTRDEENRNRDEKQRHRDEENSSQRKVPGGTGTAPDTQTTPPEGQTPDTQATPPGVQTPPPGGQTKEPADVHSGAVNWAAKGQQYTKRSGRSSWLPIAATIVVIALIAITIFLLTGSSWMNSDSTPSPTGGADREVELESDAGDLHLNLVQNEQNENTPPPVAELDGTLYLMVYAAHRQLDPVRVWSDLKPRFDPYWQERGEAFLYEFGDSIQIRGPYEGMMLFLNGHRIDDFHQQYYSEESEAIVLTRNLFSDDPEWAQTTPLEVPEGTSAPDTVRHRPTFTSSATP